MTCLAAAQPALWQRAGLPLLCGERLSAPLSAHLERVSAEGAGVGDARVRHTPSRGAAGAQSARGSGGRSKADKESVLWACTYCLVKGGDFVSPGNQRTKALL